MRAKLEDKRRQGLINGTAQPAAPDTGHGFLDLTPAWQAKQGAKPAIAYFLRHVT